MRFGGKPGVQLEYDIEDHSHSNGRASAVEIGLKFALSTETLASRLELQASKTARQHAVMHSNLTTSGKVLFMVYSDSNFYRSHVKWIMDTWGGALPTSDFVVVADKAPDSESSRDMHGVTVHTTACPMHTHEAGMCCKWAEAAILAVKLLEQNPDYEWVVLSDDDVYIRTNAAAALLAKSKPADGGPLVLGAFYCKSGECKQGLCGGAGYAATPDAMRALIGPRPAVFVAENMRQCTRCSEWADLALSMVMRKRGLRMEDFPGTYGNRNTKPCFDAMLSAEEEPILLHYIKSEAQMTFLHNLFTGPGTPPQEVVKQKKDLCATFNQKTWCAASTDPRDLPWKESPDKVCTR